MVTPVLALILSAATFGGRANDTLFVMETSSFTIASRNRGDILPAAPLRRAALVYEQIFGHAPPKVWMFVEPGQVDPSSDPPTARDTVRLAPTGDYHTLAPRRAREVREAVFMIARSWIQADVEREVEQDTTRNETLVIIPNWLEVGAAMLVAFDDADWPAVMAESEDVLDVLSIRSLFINRDPDALTKPQAMALAVQYAAMVTFFRERDGALLISAPANLARGFSLERRLLRGDVDTAWRSWYHGVVNETRRDTAARMHR